MPRGSSVRNYRMPDGGFDIQKLFCAKCGRDISDTIAEPPYGGPRWCGPCVLFFFDEQNRLDQLPYGVRRGA